MAAIGFTATRFKITIDQDDEVALLLKIPLVCKDEVLKLAALPVRTNLAVAINPL